MAGRYIDLTGQRFGRWTVISRAKDYISPNGYKSTQFLCECDCGNRTIVRGCNLRNGKSKSCGCLQPESVAKANSTHGDTGSRLYRIWKGIKSRCYISSSSNFEHYGGRGIQVCEEWKNSFEAFKTWALLNGYTDKLSIDRIDSDGDYKPENCRWVTNEIQARNRKMFKNSKSGISGVSWREDMQKWTAKIGVDKKEIFLGNYENKEDAIKARQDAEKKYWN
ncbi:MAG: AP2 domain-containing protein [Blautia sp.]|jgi:hypothetical protein